MNLLRKMQRFTEKIVRMMKGENLFDSQGGPIILSYIENEHGAQSKLLGAARQNYVTWAAKMAVEMGTGVLWVMYKEDLPKIQCIMGEQILDAWLVVLSSLPATTMTLYWMNMAHVHTTDSGDYAAFLSNVDDKSSARVVFNNMHYNLPPWSVSILPDYRNLAFNTAKLECKHHSCKMLPTSTQMFLWENVDEDLTSLDDSFTYKAPGLLEQINVTRGTTDYLWYITSVDMGSSEFFLHGELPTLMVQSTGHAVFCLWNKGR